MAIAKQLFGRTGHSSTRTIFGAASLSHVTQEEADKVLEVLLRYGVNHIDVAASYGDAELRIAPWLAQYRSQFYVATKTDARTAQEAQEDLHRSLIAGRDEDPPAIVAERQPVPRLSHGEELRHALLRHRQILLDGRSAVRLRDDVIELKRSAH